MHEKFGEFRATGSFSSSHIPENITELFLFLKLESLSKNKNIKIHYLISIKHHSFPAQNKHRREEKQITKTLKS